VKLRERLASVGVACSLVYPGAPEIIYPTPFDFLVAKLRSPTP
jgi:hypothetical protein